MSPASERFREKKGREEKEKVGTIKGKPTRHEPSGRRWLRTISTFYDPPSDFRSPAWTEERYALPHPPTPVRWPNTLLPCCGKQTTWTPKINGHKILTRGIISSCLYGHYYIKTHTQDRSAARVSRRWGSKTKKVLIKMTKGKEGRGKSEGWVEGDSWVRLHIFRVVWCLFTLFFFKGDTG